jgi:nucleotide-binding universal stress UspA family protein
MNSKRYVILVGIDFSELADRALEQALVVAAQRTDAEVHVLSIATPPVALDASYAIPAYGALDDANLLSGATERLHLHVQRQLQRFGVEHPELSLPVRVVSNVTIGTPAHGIAQMASDIAADLVVIGTHNRRGIERLLLGSVAEGTVRHARCPVLVIPAEPPQDEIQITPPCSECVRARRGSAGQQLWCAQHRERHGRRHTYHQSDRAGTETNFPLVVR